MKVTINPASGTWHAPGHGPVKLKWAAHAECGCVVYVAWDYKVESHRNVVIGCSEAHMDAIRAFNAENEESVSDPEQAPRPAIVVAAEQLERHLSATEGGSDGDST